MTEENKRDDRTSGESGSSASSDKENESGDPGRTPGSAEGDRETVEQDLRDKNKE